MPIEDLKMVPFGTQNFQAIRIGTYLLRSEEDEIMQFLYKNVDLFSCAPSGMPGIDEDVVYLGLYMDQYGLDFAKSNTQSI